MTRPRLIVSDLDGTFLSPDGTISDVNRSAVEVAARQGIAFVAATGRPIRWLTLLAELRSAHPLVIASNGAVLWDLAAREVVEFSAVDAACARELCTRLRVGVPGIYFGVETIHGFRCEPGTPTGHAESAEFVADVLDTDDPILKVLGFHGDLDSAELDARVEGLAGDLVTVTHSTREGLGLVEISALGVSKASALIRLCEKLGVEPGEVAAFGDMPNDAAMLAWAGIPHVVANAHRSLVDAGFPVVGSNADSGVGRQILALLG